MLGDGRKGNMMVKELPLTLMEIGIKVNGRMVKKMVKEFILGEKVNGKVKSM